MISSEMPPIAVWIKKRKYHILRDNDVSIFVIYIIIMQEDYKYRYVNTGWAEGFM